MYQELLAPIHSFLKAETPDSRIAEAKKPENPHIELISLECRHGGFCTHTKTSNTAPKVNVHKSYIELSLLVQSKRYIAHVFKILIKVQKKT